MARREFSKYASRGAYHWHKVSRNILTHHCFTVARYDIALQLAGEVSGKRIADFGCGDGAFLHLIAKRGGVCTGFDTDQQGLNIAKEELQRRGIAAHLVSRYEELPKGEFDVVFLLEVIEHVTDPELLLTQVHQLLAPGGILIVTTPMRLTETPVGPEHVREYFPTELRHELSRFFQVEKMLEVIPLAAAEIYYWRPRILLGAPVAKWLMNFMSVCLGKNPIYGIGTIDRYYMQLAARCRKTAVDT